ncbi:MAG: hypothetical protein GX051_08275 [Clostridiales bacterium]|nr:hypothetical protein [Clostridiales bacterium]
MSKEKTTRILKSLCVILVAVGLIALSPMLGFDEGAAFLPEADAAVVWDGTVAGNYYNSGSGTSDSPWIITTPQQLAKLAQVVNNGTLDTSGKYFRLGADLDLNNVSWTPIGTSSNYFKGTFVGIGYTISNLTAGSSLENRGLFGVASGAYLSYITITNVSITNTEGFVGSLCGNFRGGSSARDCHVNGYIFLGNTSPTSQVECIGGMFGRVRDAASISNCSVKVTNQYKKTISGWSWLGGFVGQVYGSGTKSFLNCTVDGLTVIAQHTNANTPPRIGGFFGDMTDGGSSMTCTYKGCAVLNCTIQGAYYIGGFGFALRDNTEVSGCCVSNTSITDNGTMSGSTDNEVGGLFGFVADSTVKIRLCYSLISNFVFRGSSAGYVGAIVGKNEGGSGIYSSSSTSATYGNGNYYLALSAGMTTGDGTSNSGNNISENYLKPVSSVAYFQSGNVASLLNVSRETLSTKMGVDYPYYYTQQNGNFISGIPVPGSSSNATAEAVFWCDDVNIPSGTPQAKHFQTLTFTGIDVTGAYYSSLRREMYINVGQTGAFNAVADPGWDFKIHVTSTSGSAYDYTYALNDYTSFVLDSATYRTSYIVKVELYVKEYTITYKSGTKTINPTGAPTTFSLRSWPSLSGVTSSREYWVFGGWNTAADGTGTAVSQVKTSTLGYNNVTLYADWNLEQQTGTDGKVYRIIYTFEHLEEFSRLIRTSPSANAKLCSIQISYPQFRVNLKTGEVELTEARASSFVSRPTRELETIRSYAANLSITQQRAFLSMISGMTSEYTEYNYQWKPANYTYSGIFDGCGNTISGVRYGGAAALSNEKYGLFATLGSTGVIKNINFTGGSMIITSSLTGNTIWAGLAVGNALSGSQIINCVSSVPIDVSGTGTSGNKYV